MINMQQVNIRTLEIRRFIEAYKLNDPEFKMTTIDLKNSPTISSSDLAWAAGFFDGEGTVGLYCRLVPNKQGKEYYSYQLVAIIMQASNDGTPKTLIRFNTIIKVGSINGPYYRNTKNHKPKYSWRASNADVRYMLNLLWPYLGEVKQQQAIKAGYIPNV